MCLTDMPKVEETTEFTSRMLDILNGAGLAMMVSIGHRCGLFDAMADMEPSDSEQIAARTQLNERYVREWLGR